MEFRSPSRGRSRTRSKSATSSRPASRRSNRSETRRMSASPTRRDRSLSRSRSRSPDDASRNGNRGRVNTRSISRDRSRSPGRDARRPYRDRSYSRSLSRDRIQSSKIVVEKLTKNVTEAHLREIFGSYGNIESIDLPLNRQFMVNRGTAYIIYDHPSASESAISHMHEAQLDGAVITVSIVLPRRAFSRSPPPAQSERHFGGSGRGGLMSQPPRGPSSRGPPPRGASSRTYAPPESRRGGYNGRRDSYDMPERDSRWSASPPRRRRQRSYSGSRSPSRSPPRRRGPPGRSPPRRRRRSPSYSSYSSYSRSRTRSLSRTRSPSRTRDRNRRYD